MENKQNSQQIRNEDFFLQRMLLKRKRRSKRAQIKESFCCQCGKTYLSFSALYLHVRNKHNFKITTKINEEVCRIESSPDFIKYTFYIIGMEKGNQNNDCQNQNNILQNQQKKIGKKQKRSPDAQGILKYFEEYIQILDLVDQHRFVIEFIKYAIQESQTWGRNQKQKISSFPYHLNSFMQIYIPQKFQIDQYSQKWSTICRILQNLSKWMLENKLTNLTVINDNH